MIHFAAKYATRNMTIWSMRVKVGSQSRNGHVVFVSVISCDARGAFLGAQQPIHEVILTSKVPGNSSFDTWNTSIRLKRSNSG